MSLEAPQAQGLLTNTVLITPRSVAPFARQSLFQQLRQLLVAPVLHVPDGLVLAASFPP